MKSVDLIVATRGRYRKLIRMITSVPLTANGIPIKIRIVTDGDADSYAKLSAQGFDVQAVNSHRGSVFCRNIMTAQAQDAILYATDDITFERGAIDCAIRSLLRVFPDEDGVVGFNQRGNIDGNFSKSGIALVGYPFLLRYPQKLLFYPKYFHFACQEIERGATILKRFYFDEKAYLYHFHPSSNPKEFDKTHIDARQFHQRDRATSQARRLQKKTWGVNG